MPESKVRLGEKDKASRQTEKLTALHTHALRLSVARSIDEIASYTLDAMAFALGFDYSDVRFVQDGWLRCKGARGMKMINADLRLDGPGITVKAANSKKTIRVADTRKESSYVDRIHDKGRESPTMLSELAVPVIVEHETFAVLNVESTQPNAITDDDQKLLETLAAHLASAIGRLREEEAVRRSLSLYRATLESTADGILVVGMTGRMTTSNLRFAEMWRIPEDLLENKDESQMLQFALDQLEDPAQFLGKVKELYANPEKESFDVLRFKDGRTFERYSQPQRLEQGIVGRVWSFRDITERKRMEAALANERNVLRTLIDNLPDIVYVKDIESRFVITNPVHVHHLRAKTLDEIVGKTDFDLYPRQLAASYYSDEQSVIRSGQPLVDREELTIDPEGKTRWLLTTKVPVRNDQGRVIGIAGIGRDITERKRMQDELRRHSEHLEELIRERTSSLAESEARYRRLFESSPISLWEEDFSEVKRYLDELRSNGINDLRRRFSEHPDDLAKCASIVKVVDVNEATLRLYGAKSVEELRCELPRVLSRESQEAFREELVALGEGERRFASEFDDQTLAGEIRHVSLTLNVVPGYEDTLGRVLVSIVDLTERKQMEEELRAAGERLEYTIDFNPAVVYLGKPLDDMSDYYTVYKSRNVMTMVGFGPEQFMEPEGEKFWASRVHPDDLQKYMEGASKLWEDDHRICEYRFLHKNGTYRWILEEANVIRDPNGTIRDVVGCWTDITERKRLEESLLKSQRLATIGELAAMVGHDLRNPLQGITTATYLLRNDDSLTKEQQQETIQRIDDSVDKSNKIINDLLDYSREIHPALEEVSPKEIIRTALEAVKIPAPIQVQDQSQEWPVITVDSEKVRRVFINLITNAVDAMPNGGTLTIGSQESNDFVQFKVSDTGTGLDKQILENLWKPLQTTKAKGMGLGLPICKRIIDAHGGEITAESNAAEGTTFTIRLPIKPRP
jgi:PAS domain S-box-containing protein